MLGHVVLNYFNSLNKYEIINLSKSRADESTIIINALNVNEIEKIIEDKKPDIVINCIGLLVQESANHPDKAIYLNSYLPHYLAKLGKQMHYKLIHISTDCVFSGLKGDYKEDDFKDAKDFYGKTKALGEIINNYDLTIRSSIIGPEIKKNGTGLFDWIFKQKGTVKGYVNAIWTGLTTLELARAIEKAINNNVSGLYNLVPDSPISKYDLLLLIKEIWDLKVNIVPDYDVKVNKSLIDTRKDFGYEVKNYREMLLELKQWMNNHRDLYPHYFSTES